MVKRRRSKIWLLFLLYFLLYAVFVTTRIQAADPVEEWEPDFSLVVYNGVVYEQSGRLFFLEPVAEFVDMWETWTDVRHGELILPPTGRVDPRRPLEDQIDIEYIDTCSMCDRIVDSSHLVHDLAELLTQYWYGWPELQPGEGRIIFEDRLDSRDVEVEISFDGFDSILSFRLVDYRRGRIAVFDAIRSSPSFILIRDDYLIAGIVYFGGSGHSATINVWRLSDRN